MNYTEAESFSRSDRATTTAHSWDGDLFLAPAMGHRTRLLDAIFTDTSSW
jgi:hypothetical protein